MQVNRKKRTWMNAGKRLFFLVFSLGLAYGASAQRGFAHGGVAVGHGGFYHGGYAYPRTYVGVGFGLGYPLGWGFGYPYGWYGPWYAPYPPYYYGYGMMPNQLELQIRDIKSDYDAQIKDVKHDKALSRKERRDKVNQLKIDRDNAIVQARHDYFYHSRRNYNYQNQGQQNQGQQNQQNQNQQQPKSNGNGSSSSSGEDPGYQAK